MTVHTSTGKVKALFLPAERPYNDFGDVVKIARAEATKILGTGKVKVLSIISCSYPVGYVAVVQSLGGKGKSKEKR